MDLSRSLSHSGAQGPHSARHPVEGAGSGGLAFCDAALSSASPRHLERNVIAPIRTIGMGEKTSLKVSFWHSTVEEAPQAGDPSFVSFSLRTSPGKAWRDAAPSGAISMLAFEGAHWRFEQPLSFVQLHLPFSLLGAVCDTLFDRELAHADLSMPADMRDTQLGDTLRSIKDRVSSIEPTNLLLDSWALILSEALLRRLSSHGERQGRASFGKLPGRGIARVVDYIEAGIDQDLRLTALAEVAAMSVYHFARCFREAVGLSPHAYVLSRRIDRARALLSQGEDSLAQVALACGFASQAHLTSVFRRGLGVTPGGYRRLVRT